MQTLERNVLARKYAHALSVRLSWLSSLQRQAEQDGFINTEEIDVLLGEDAILAGALEGGAPGGAGGGGGDVVGTDSRCKLRTSAARKRLNPCVFAARSDGWLRAIVVCATQKWPPPRKGPLGK